jgi:hypothetical protein
MVIIGLIITGIVNSNVLTPIVVVGIIDQKGTGVKDSRVQGFEGSSDPPQNRRTRMLKNYKNLKVWQKAKGKSKLCIAFVCLT